MNLPVTLGDAHNVVAHVHLDREGLEWLAYLVPEGDTFRDDCMKALDRVDEELEMIRETPMLNIFLVGTLRDDR